MIPRASLRDWLIGRAIEALIVVIVLAVLFGCATTSPAPEPLIGEVRSAVVNIAIPEPCTDASKWPPRPRSHAAPVGADGVRVAHGLRADAFEWQQYALELEAELRRCSKFPTTERR